MSPLVIACDIDEVIFPYIAGYVKYYNRIHGGSTLSPSDFHSYNFSLVHGGTEADIADLVYAFHEEPEFRETEPIAGSLHAIEQLRNLGAQVHFVSARQKAISTQTVDWIGRHFGNVGIERIHLGNHFTRSSDLDTQTRSKAEMCMQIGAKVLIDDSVSNALECAQVGMQVFLFDLHGEYGWNKQPAEHPNISRVLNWEQVVDGVRKCKRSD